MMENAPMCFHGEIWCGRRRVCRGNIPLNGIPGRGLRNGRLLRVWRVPGCWNRPCTRRRTSSVIVSNSPSHFLCNVAAIILDVSGCAGSDNSLESSVGFRYDRVGEISIDSMGYRSADMLVDDAVAFVSYLCA